ncbi:MAG: cell division protein FtsH, partial [Parachlamydiaceae bacterium]
LNVKGADPVDKVTILPRGMSLGATMFLPQKNKVSYWKNEILDQLAVLMGGRCAEEIFVKDISSGAQQDIERATHLARSMVCEWGMSDVMGAVAYDERSDSGQYLGWNNYHDKKYSEDTAKAIDKEVKSILDEAHRRALAILEANRDKVELMTEMLMKYETLIDEDIRKIANGEWSIEDKDRRLKEQEELHKKPVATPPPPPPSSTQSKVANPSPQPS